MWGEHEREVVRGHLVFVLLFGGVIEQVQQELEERAVGRGQQEQEQLQGLDLTLLIRQARLIPSLVEQVQLCGEEQMELIRRCEGSVREVLGKRTDL